jgi:penicillin-binding protein 1A
MRILGKLILTLAIGAAGLVAAVVALAPAARALFTAGSSGGSTNVLTLAELPETSNVYDDQGNLIATFHADQNRVPVTFAQVPSSVVAAVVDTEDAKFWVHHGVNVWATARALFSNSKAGGVFQGGSTITQQLVKNTLLTDQRTLTRKVKEAVLAIRLENKLTKQQIMERYLNTVYFGNGAYGIGAAAQVYFDEPVEKLTPVQGALLAGLIQDPSGYDPIQHPGLASSRRSFVLNAMVSHGDMTKAAAAVAKLAPVPDHIKTSPAPPLDAQVGYFVEEVKQRLLSDPELGSTAQARYNAVFNGGLKIYTTLDPSLEADARQAVADQLPPENGKWTATLVSVDSKTGAVRALVGGPGYNLSQYRIATEGPGRQPGSSFKPIVLALALKEGYNISAGVDGSSPCTFLNPGGAPYTAHNAEGGEGGEYSLVSATAGSINCAFIRLGLDVGLDKVAQMGRDLGITTPLTPEESMSIGSEEVRPIDMAGVYDTFADDGLHHTPYLVDRVLDRNGNVILRGGDSGTQVLAPDKVREELIALRAVMTSGTGYNSQLKDRPSWGKTGTAENFDNAWFDGFTPQLTTVVWMGSPVGNVPMTNVCGQTQTGRQVCPGTVFGATIPAPIWKEYMDLALAGQPAEDFPPPNPYDMGYLFSVNEPKFSYTGCAPNSTITACYGSGGGPAATPTTVGGTTPTTAPAASTTTSPTATTAPANTVPTVPTTVPRRDHPPGGPPTTG